MSCDFAMTACGNATIFLPVLMQSNVCVMLLDMLVNDITYNKFRSFMMVLMQWYQGDITAQTVTALWQCNDSAIWYDVILTHSE